MTLSTLSAGFLIAVIAVAIELHDIDYERKRAEFEK